MKTKPSPFASRPAAILVCLGFAAHAHGAVHLGTAEAFAVLGGAGVTNTGPTVIYGDLGVSPANSITGLGEMTVHGEIHQADAVAAEAQVDARIAYNYMAGLASTQIMPNETLGGLTLTPGVYLFSSTAQLTGQLTLDGAGEYVFQITSGLNSASGASIITIGGADPSQVYFQVGTSATFGTNNSLLGTFIADQSITVGSGSTFQAGSSTVDFGGRLIALEAVVTLDSNIIVIPEPSSSLLLVSGLVSLLTLRKRSRIAG